MNKIPKIKTWHESRKTKKEIVSIIRQINAPSLDLKDRLQLFDKLFYSHKEIVWLLKKDLTLLEPDTGLKLIGSEVNCINTFIFDMFCEDKSENLVVIEIKTHTAGYDAIVKILGYMTCAMKQLPERNVRGIVLADGFSEKYCYPLYGVKYDINSIDSSNKDFRTRLFQKYLDGCFPTDGKEGEIPNA